MKTTVVFSALPGVVFSAPMPKADGSSVPYSQMRVGSDSTLSLGEGQVVIVVEHDEEEEETEAIVLAYRHLLKAIVRATYEEFLEARAGVIASQQREASL